jgi:LPS export ABC transporter protein LptC
MATTIDTRGTPASMGLRATAALVGEARERAFRVARRHTRLVRLLRFALPCAAVVIFGAYLLTLTIGWRLGAAGLKVGEIAVTADDLTMKNPSYFGVTKDGGHYEVRAKRAVIQFNEQAPIKLIDIDGRLVQTNNVTTKLEAKHGLLDNSKNELELFDGIRIDASNGLTARMTRAVIYTKENRIVSREPVRAHTATGSVQSQSFVMQTATRQASFRGDVVVRLAQAVAGEGTAVGLGRDQRQPVEIRAAELDVDDAHGSARFSGNVIATQGDTTLKSPELMVEYEGNGAGQLNAAQPGQPANASTQLKLLLARGGVVMNTGTDRRVTSDQADFDARADTALFAGNVLVNQGKNVLQGARLFVDRRAGKSRLEAPPARGASTGRIAATFYQADAKAPPAPKAKTPASDAPGAMLGSFRNDPTAPMDIEADTLDINDGARTATFRVNVKAQQGDVVIRTKELVAHYTGQSGLSLGGEGDGAASNTQITRIEAKDKVVIISKDGQTASGDWAIFDVKANTALIGGQVVVTRGKDVVEGPRLKIDLTTGMYRFEVENDAPAASAPAISASPAEGKASLPLGSAGRSCPPGKQCLLFYPKETQEKAKDAAKKLLQPEGAPKAGSKAWEPSNSASPVMRGP